MDSQPPAGHARGGCIVVGVVPHGPDAVIDTAAGFAARLGAELVFAWADASRYAVRGPNGTTWSEPIDPDSADAQEPAFDPALSARIDRALEGTAVRWSAQVLAGEPGAALALLAHERAASMIVVGSRRRRAGTGIREFFTGSVAVHLAHRQSIPVLVVPALTAGTAPVPWPDA